MENRLQFQWILPLTPRPVSGYNSPSLRTGRRRPGGGDPDENGDIEETVPAGEKTDPGGGQLACPGVPVGRGYTAVRRESEGGHRDGRGREHIPRLRLLLGADDPRPRPPENRFRDPESRGPGDELRGAHGRRGRACPPHPQGIPLDREGTAGLLSGRGGDEGRPSGAGGKGGGQDGGIWGGGPRA